MIVLLLLRQLLGVHLTNQLQLYQQTVLSLPLLKALLQLLQLAEHLLLPLPLLSLQLKHDIISVADYGCAFYLYMKWK